jgi:5-methylcytosine-specific restriction endonuclease McrA
VSVWFAGEEIKPLAVAPCEAAQRLGITEHELKALVEEKVIPCIWISTKTVRFSIAAIERLQGQEIVVPAVVWQKPALPIPPEDHPEEAFGRTRYTRARYVGSNPIWRKRVFERDNYQCRRCGCDDRRVLNAHHVKPRNRNPGLALDVENGITLCANCHKIEHVINPVRPVRRKKYTRRDSEL